MKTALELKKLVKKYRGRTALDELDLAVPAGSIFGLIGSNGAGKTTAMSISAGLLRYSSGTVNVLESGPFNSDRHAGRFTLLPQDAHPPPLERVESLLRFYGRLQGIPASELQNAVDIVLDWTNLKERRRSAVRELSHGMLRRLTIAQAFLGDPECIMLDEPLSGLDPREQVRIRELIREGRGRRTIVISSHQMSDIESLCTEAAFIEHGRLVRQDTLSRLTQRQNTLTFVMAAPARVDTAPLQSALPEAEFVFNPDVSTLRARFPETLRAENVNRELIPLLWQQGVMLQEIRCGFGLEDEYLRSTKENQTVAQTTTNAN